MPLLGRGPYDPYLAREVIKEFTDCYASPDTRGSDDIVTATVPDARKGIVFGAYRYDRAGCLSFLHCLKGCVHPEEGILDLKSVTSEQVNKELT